MDILKCLDKLGQGLRIGDILGGMELGMNLRGCLFLVHFGRTPRSSIESRPKKYCLVFGLANWLFITFGNVGIDHDSNNYLINIIINVN